MKKKKESTTNDKKTSVSEDTNQNDTENNINTQLDNKPGFWDIVSPDGLKIPNDSEDYGIVKQSLATNTYFRPFYIPPEGYPRTLQTNWIYNVVSTGEMDVVVDVHKTHKTQAIKLLQKQLTMLKSNLSFQTKRGNIDQIQDLETKISDTELLMAEIQFSDNDSYNVSVLGNIYAQNKKELDKYSEFIEDEMSGMFFNVASTWNRVKSGFRSVLPFGDNELKHSHRNMDRRALSTFSPFISGSGTFNGGIPLGNNVITGQKEFYNAFGNDTYRPDNYNQAIFGASGSGKSLAIKLMMARETAGMGVFSRSIDIEGEMVKITQRLGGINLNISEEADIRINPLAINVTHIPIDTNDDEELKELQDDDEKEVIDRDDKTVIAFVPLREKINEVIDFFDIVARGKNGGDDGLNVFERNYLEEGLQYVYLEQYKISTNPSSLYESEPKEVDGRIIQSRVRKSEPTISDIYDFLTKRYQNEHKAERLIAAIRPFLNDGSKPIFDGQTYLGKNIVQDLDTARLVNFNISSMEEGFLRPIAYHVILNYIWEYFVKNIDLATKKKIVLCDEAWTMVDNDQTISFLEKVARRSRKRNCGLRIASQDFVRFLENPKARGVLQNTYSFFFLRQQKIDLKSIKENFDLSDGEVDTLFGNPDKGEGIFRIGKSSVWLRTDPSEEEIVFVESNTAVLDQMMQKKQLERNQM